MNKFQRYALVVIRLAFLAANLPIPNALHAQLFLQKLKPQAQPVSGQVPGPFPGPGVQALTTQVPPASANVPAGLVTASTDNAAPAVLSPKQPGVLRIGVALPANDLDSKGKPAEDESVRAAEMKLLSGSKLEAVALQAIVPALALEEARQLDCDYVLTSSVTQQKVEGQSRFAKLGGLRGLQMATTAAQFIPTVSVTAMVATALVSTVAAQGASQSLMRFNRNVQANSDVTLAYTLSGIDGSVALSGTEKARSKADGDDVLTGLLSTAAGKITGKVVR